MRDISELPIVLDNYFNKLTLKLKDAMDESCNELIDEIISRVQIPAEMFLSDKHGESNAMLYSMYCSGFEKKVELDKYEIKGKVLNNVRVEIWREWGGVNIPFGFLIEFGTGPIGENSTDNQAKITLERIGNFPFGSRYANSYPWDKLSTNQKQSFGSWGSAAKPHWIPACNLIKWKLVEKVKKCI